MRTYQSTPRFYVVLGFVLAVLVCWWPVLNYNRVFSGMDFLNLLCPQMSYSYDTLCNGRIALWSHYEFLGVPLFAAMQSAQAYPGTIILYGLTRILSIFTTQSYGFYFAYQMVIILHIIFAAIGAGLFYQEYFQNKGFEALLAGIIFACNGLFLGHIEQLNSVAAISFVPWYFYFATKLINSRTPAIGSTKYVLAILFALGVLVGHPQYLVLSCVFIFVMVILRLFLQKHNGVNFLLSICYALVFVGVFASLLAAVQILPTQELSHLSERIFPYEDPDAPSFSLKYIFAFFIPRAFNRLTHSAIPIAFTELECYSSIVALLAFFSLVLLWKFTTDLRLVLIALVILVFAFLYSLGRVAYISLAVQAVVPYLKNARVSARSLVIVILFYGILSAYGLRLITQIVSQYRNLIIILLCAVAVLDLALTHRNELNSRMIDKRVLSDVSSLPNTAPGRLYRFTRDDTDFYLDYRATAVSRRIQRVQPNMNYSTRIEVIDGYEEGLLPTLNYANFMRKYNRNLRAKEPDPKLLALLGTKYMLSEYPINSPNYKLLKENPFAKINTFEVGYTGSKVYDLDKLGLDFNVEPVKEKSIVPLGQTVQAHLFSNVSSSTLSQASAGFQCEFSSNSIIINKDSPAQTQRLLLSFPCYPGWKTKQGILRPVGELTSILHLNDDILQTQQICLDFSPYSFRLGLFVTLGALTMLLSLLTSGLFPRRRK